MSEKISLNIALFKDNVISLRNSVTSIDGQMSTSETLEKTNITPFIDDLENTIRALELLIEYKALFQADLEVLEDVGEKIREKDTQLSQV
ncbi:TIGR04197 family type VII secretion effector [Pseudogracilibacillus sp. SO30301A]|uniref:TIGR04197 family type VII secretion effector n=1 Tax=Pseudogracilibacillus sp. SO30301A TaxID=3098291 RepID=UPI00300E471A